jgi:hypothetical protein
MMGTLILVILVIRLVRSLLSLISLIPILSGLPLVFFLVFARSLPSFRSLIRNITSLISGDVVASDIMNSLPVLIILALVMHMPIFLHSLSMHLSKPL